MYQLESACKHTLLVIYNVKMQTFADFTNENCLFVDVIKIFFKQL